MRLRIVHDTHYTYDQPVKSMVQAMRLTPRGHDGQHVLRWRIEPSVDGRLKPGEDSLGNLTHVFWADAPAGELCVRVTGEVETDETHGVVRGTVERAPALYFLRETPLTEPDAALRDLAEANRGEDILTSLHALLACVHQEVRYETGPTHAATTAAEALKLGRGVCQDLTHIFVAAARVLGIPARYVSGYFLRADGVTKQEAGHAWAEAKVEGLGWVGFDPANGISTGEGHVRVAVGLDYLGAAPIRGSRYGGGEERLEVKLTVEPVPQRQSQVQDGEGQAQSQSQGAKPGQSQSHSHRGAKPGQSQSGGQSQSQS